MQSLMKFLFGLFLLWLPIATVLYLVSNGPVGEAKDAEITHLIVNAFRLVDDRQDRIKARASHVSQAIKREGGDGDIGIYKALKKKEKVTDLQATISSSIPAREGSLDRVKIAFGYNDLKVELVVIIINQRSFMKPYAIDAFMVESILIEGEKKVIINESEDVAEFLFDVATSKGIQVLDTGKIVPRFRSGLPRN